MATPWMVRVRPSASSELAELDDNVKAEALSAIAELREDPFPPDSIKLRGHADLYRVRLYLNQYRIVYQVSLKQRRVIVTRVRRRKDVYRGL